MTGVSGGPALPDLVDLDQDDPEGVVRVFLARYFTPGLIDSYIRTFVPAGLGYVLSWAALNFTWFELPNTPSATFSSTVTLASIAGYYFLARMVEKRWPKAGRWMVALNLTKARPVYVKAAAAPAVEAAAALPAEAVEARPYR